ncbi:MAG: penicillin-binding transpeptidase domain-containing protein, partial [Eubacteriales bacterium]|nr:penicillin-binding transpeptidase domain-containing protein [Eubacteriales bacterium]
SGLALGTSGITPIELAAAYATIANSGTYLEALSFTKVVDSHEDVILNADEIREERDVFDESTAWLVTDMLVNAVESGTGTAAQIDGMAVGGKTGTNQNATGVLFAGITPYYTATLWIGHDQYKPLDGGVYASNSAAPLWQYFMSQILEEYEDDDSIIDAIPEELGLVKVRVCSVSGMLATDACDEDIGGHTPVYAWYKAGTEPTEECDLHDIYAVCNESGKIVTEYCPDDQIDFQGLIFLPSDSVYWKLTASQLDDFLPGVLPALENGLTISDLTPDMDEYYDYFCSIHTLEWATELMAMASAIDEANTQIDVSNAVLANPDYAMSMEDRQQLIDKIAALEALMETEDVTSAAIVQMTQELKELTDMLVALYTPEPTP